MHQVSGPQDPISQPTRGAWVRYRHARITNVRENLERGNMMMKIRNKMIINAVTYCFLIINLFVCSTPAYAWTYNIQWGDSLYQLSERYGTEVNDLKEANQLSSDKILAGEKIWVPDSSPRQNSQVQGTENSNNLYLLARLINGEARGESFEGKSWLIDKHIRAYSSLHMPIETKN